MGISIAVSHMPLPPAFPLPLVIRLTCDSAPEDAFRGFFCLGFEEFAQADGFVMAHSLAMARGWLERQGPNGGLDMPRHDVILPARREPQFDLDIEPFPEVRRRKPVRDWEQRERRRRK